MVELTDVVKALKELIQISKRVEENTKEIRGIHVRLERLEEGQKGVESAVHSLERTIDARLAAIEDRLAVKDEIYTLKERMLVLEKRLEEKVKT